MQFTATGTDTSDWWRDARLWALLTLLLAAFSINVIMASATFFMFLSIPVVVASSFAGLRGTLALGACALTLAAVSVALVEDQFFSEPEAPLRIIVFVLVIAASAWMAFARERAEAQRRIAEAELDRRARFDELTGLPNREEALELVAASLQRARRAGDRLDVLFVDIDCFKDVNDSHGHLAGDTVLQAVADRVRSHLREEDFAARIGGDEFTVVLHGAGQGDDALVVADRIRAAVAQPLVVRGATITPTVSIGVTRAGPLDDVDSVFSRADAAMYRAKASGRNQVLSG
ncbi:MAG: GGDEF domain-containing protein [Actinomycetota bacterium]|nr:GGDEF domain-containing protein [Actinomycetota bacterium]